MGRVREVASGRTGLCDERCGAQCVARKPQSPTSLGIRVGHHADVAASLGHVLDDWQKFPDEAQEVISPPCVWGDVGVAQSLPAARLGKANPVGIGHDVRLVGDETRGLEDVEVPAEPPAERPERLAEAVSGREDLKDQLLRGSHFPGRLIRVVGRNEFRFPLLDA